MRVTGERRAADDGALAAAARALAVACRSEMQHVEQVTRLALAIFDQLRPLHGGGDRDRLLLECAGLLHDIGWIGGGPSHHKRAMRMILDDATLPLGGRDRLLVANVARYHRRALPRGGHRRYAALGRADRRRVRMLAGILRVADGLDCTHRASVGRLTCHATRAQIIVCGWASREAELEMVAAREKGDLLERQLQRRLRIRI